MRGPSIRNSSSGRERVLESVLSLIAQEARKAGVTVRKRFDPAVGKRSIDAGLLKQAFLNLILNAIQAMPQGGVMTVESGLRNSQIEISVSDTGERHPGREPEEALQPLFYDQEERHRAGPRNHPPDHREPRGNDRCDEPAGRGNDVHGADTGVSRPMPRDVSGWRFTSVTRNTNYKIRIKQVKLV